MHSRLVILLEQMSFPNQATKSLASPNISLKSGFLSKPRLTYLFWFDELSDPNADAFLLLCLSSCRYASLYFCCAIEEQDNELITLEVIHRFVELLDKYFGSVCELDIIFNFEKAYFILDEFLMGGEIQDTSKKSVLKAIEQADLLQE
ncbi:hypothetical protein GOODEAATRI_029891, partial [Goodea atripinnis]